MLVAATLAVHAGGASAQGVGGRDPSLILQDGQWHMYCTGPGVQEFVSDDGTEYRAIGSVFDDAPEWLATALPPTAGQAPRSEGGSPDTQAGGAVHIWSPHVARHDGTYYLFYSVSSPGGNESAIGVATNKTLKRDDDDYQWTHHGPIVTSIPGRDMYNAVDPCLAFDDDGAPMLVFGSFWSGVKQVRLHEDLTRVSRPEQWRTLARRHRYWKLDEAYAGDWMNGAVEGPFVYGKDGRRYLFATWKVSDRGRDRCAIVVGRSDDVRGPYRDRIGRDMRVGGGSNVVGGAADWPSVGHCCVFTAGGRDMLAFHAIRNSVDNGNDQRAELIVRPIEWDASGWPTVSLE